MLHVAMGHSDAIPVREALKQVIDTCGKNLKGHEPKAGIFFTSLLNCDYRAMLGTILEAFPGIELVGCTTDGEVSNQFGFAEDSMALMLFCSDVLKFASGCGRDVSKRPQEAVDEARDEAMGKLEAQAALALVFPDGLSTFAVPLAAVLRQTFGNEFPVYGGTAGDNFHLEQTWQFHGNQVHTDAVPVLLISGPILMSSHIQSGWCPLGPKMTITESRKSTVYKVDDKPAMDLYHHYLGTNTEEYLQFPLALFEEDNEAFSLRDPIHFNEEDGSIMFIGHLPVGAQVQLSEAGREEILKAAHIASRNALESYPGESPALALIFSCASRHQILGTLTGEECRYFRKYAPPDLNIFGFYTYGEIGPLTPRGSTVYHNDTYVVLVLGVS